MHRKLWILGVLLALVVCAACAEGGFRRAQDLVSIHWSGGDFEKAQTMLRLDDLREFQKAEVHFLTLRIKNRDDVQIAGWLNQLYIAWAEQLQSEIDLLRWKLAASYAADNQSDLRAVFNLLDYRQAQWWDALNSARMLGNVLVTYDDDSYIGHRSMADYYRVLGDREKMENELKAVEALNPDSNGLRFIRGAALAQFEKNYSEAIRYYDDALDHDPMFVKALYFKGLALHELQRSDEAVAVMTQVLEKSPKHPGARLYLSTERYVQDLAQEARQRLADTRVASRRIKDDPARAMLIEWSAKCVADRADLHFRVAGPADDDAEVRLSAVLTDKLGAILATQEKQLDLPASAFYSGQLDFDPTPGSEAREVLLHLQVKRPDEQVYTTVDIQHAPLEP